MSNAPSVSDVVDRVTKVLGDASQARDLLAQMHDKPRHWALVSGHAVLSEAEAEAAMRAARLQASGAPVQYAAGRAAFRHLMLDVDARVLIPRPETELLVDIVLDATRKDRGGVVVDVGTGTGAIALALATEGTFDHVIGTDVSLDALVVARANVERYARECRARVELRHGSVLSAVTERSLRAVVSNPPYIAFDEAAALPASVRDWEPSVALFAQEDGMAVTSQLVRDAAPMLAPGGMLAIEVDVRRAAVVAQLAGSHGAYDDVRVLPDLTGRERFVVARRREEQE